MDDVKIPEKANFVADAVKPVISEIIREKQNPPRPPGVHRHLKRRQILINSLVKKDLKKTENKPESDAPETERDIRPNILTVVIFFVPNREISFNRNHQREKRNGNFSRFQHNFQKHIMRNLSPIQRNKRK